MRNLTLMLSIIALAGLVATTGCKKSDSGEGRRGASVSEGAAGDTAQWDADDRFLAANAPIHGAPNGVVTIVTFSEFQCPFCARVLPTMERILQEYPDDVRIIFKHLPLDFHNRAEPAARASMAAHRQGKFWEFHDIAFQNQRALTDENFFAWAEQIGLDVEQFRADYESADLREYVAADAALAQRLGVRGTPNFYINGINVRGAQPFEAFQQVIEAERTAMRAAMDAGQSLGEAYGARLEANLAAAPAPEQQQQRPQARPTPDPNDVLYVPVGNSPTMGPDNALATIVVFSEFECPFCSRIRPTFDQIRENFGDQVRIVFKHNPLSFHPRAEPAARAAIAAHNQGKFWEFHDLAFDNQRALTDENFIAWATQLGLDLDRFRADMQAEATTAQIREDQELAGRLAAGGTPHSFINGVRVRGAQPYENFRTIIEQQVARANELVQGGANRAAIYDALMADANRGPARMITPEQPPAQQQQPAAQAPEARVEIPIADNVPSMGPADAPVTIVEYTDFECPFCSRFANNLKEAVQGYEDRVRIVVKQFPLAFHQNAQLAAEASLAAHAQGKFWEYHDILWENTRALQRPNLEQYAERVGLNMEQFRAALDNGTYREQVQAEFREGQGFGVQGTPTWFINGQRQVGALPPAQIRQLIEAELAAAGR